MSSVKVGPFYLQGLDVPATSVEIDPDGQVTYLDEAIGFVWKGQRRYSPPISRGSRIVRYHRMVPEWHADTSPWTARPRHRADTRRRAIEWLIVDHLKNKEMGS